MDCGVIHVAFTSNTRILETIVFPRILYFNYRFLWRHMSSLNSLGRLKFVFVARSLSLTSSSKSG